LEKKVSLGEKGAGQSNQAKTLDRKCTLVTLPRGGGGIAWRGTPNRKSWGKSIKRDLFAELKRFPRKECNGAWKKEEGWPLSLTETGGTDDVGEF